MAFAPRPGEHVRHLIELAAGGVTLVLAAVLWLARGRLSRHVTTLTGRVDRSSLLVGAGIMVLELPTALPYFAVIATIVGSDRPAATQTILLAVFNATFVAPLLALLAARTFAGEGMESRLERLRGTLERRLAALIPALVALVSVALLAIGGYGLLSDA
jgi:cytochrome c biogenesis protein CcdA